MISFIRNHMRWSAVAVVAAVALTACGGNSSTGTTTFKGTKKVGITTALTGQSTLYGQSISKGLPIAIDDINAAGGVNGYKVELDLLDDATDVSKAKDNTRQLILQDKVAVMLGAITTAQCQAAIPVAVQEKTLYVAATCNSYQLADDPNLICGATSCPGPNPYFASVVPNTFMEGTAIGLDMGKKTQFKSYYILSPNYLFGTSETKAFVASLKKTNPAVTFANPESDWYSTALSTTDYKPTINKIQAAHPDVVYSNVFAANQVAFVNQALQVDPQFFTKYNFTTLASVDDLRAIGDKYPLGVRLYSRAPFFALTNAKLTTFVNKYKAKYNGEVPSDWAIMDYDAAVYWAQGANKAGSFDGAKVRKAMEQVQYASLRGYNIQIREADGQANAGETIGTTISSNGQYPFPVYKDIVQINGNDSIPPVAKVQALQAGKCPGGDINQCP